MKNGEYEVPEWRIMLDRRARKAMKDVNQKKLTRDDLEGK